MKHAFAEFTFKAVTWAVASMPLFNDPAYDELRDCVIEVIPISATQAMIKIAGHGEVFWYNLVLQSHKKV